MLPSTPVGSERRDDRAPRRGAGPAAPLAPLPPPDARLLRARTVLELVDAGFAAQRRHPGLLLGTGITFLLPVVALAAALGEGNPTSGLLTAGSWPAGLVSILGFSLASMLMGLPLARAVALGAAGEPPSWRRCYAIAPRCWARACAAWVVVSVVRLVTAALVVPIVVVPVLVVVLAPVLALEELGARQALRRAASMGGAAFGRGLGLVLAQLGVGVTVVTAVGLLPLIVLLRLEEPWRRPLATLAQLVVGVVLCPPAAWSAASFYLDERIRHDGLDLHRRLDAWDGPPLPGHPAGGSRGGR